jgi:hypothetical protein
MKFWCQHMLPSFVNNILCFKNYLVIDLFYHRLLIFIFLVSI